MPLLVEFITAIIHFSLETSSWYEAELRTYNLNAKKWPDFPTTVAALYDIRETEANKRVAYLREACNQVSYIAEKGYCEKLFMWHSRGIITTSEYFTKLADYLVVMRNLAHTY